jgi:hypothetical protein
MPSEEADMLLVSVRSCNRLCRQATPPGPTLGLADWWRRAINRPDRGRQRL